MAAGVENLNRLPSELVFRPIRSRNLFEETVARLGQAIKLGVVPQGERFPTELELSEQLKVSRVTVREALRALEQAGLVEIRRGRHGGSFVLQKEAKQSKRQARKLAREMGPDLDDALDFRRAIEPTIVELAAERHDEKQLAQTVLSAQAVQLMADAGGLDPASFRGADSRFHLALAEMTNAPSLVGAAAEVQIRLSELLAAIPILDESIRNSRAQHQRILDAVIARDGESARSAMLEHIEATADLLHGLG